jgi:hypothetical protein
MLSEGYKKVINIHPPQNEIAYICQMDIRLISVAVAMFCMLIYLYEYEYVLTDKLGDQLIYNTDFIYGLLPFFKDRNWRSPTAVCTLISAP